MDLSNGYYSYSLHAEPSPTCSDTSKVAQFHGKKNTDLATRGREMQEHESGEQSSAMRGNRLFRFVYVSPLFVCHPVP